MFRVQGTLSLGGGLERDAQPEAVVAVGGYRPTHWNSRVACAVPVSSRSARGAAVLRLKSLSWLACGSLAFDFVFDGHWIGRTDWCASILFLNAWQTRTRTYFCSTPPLPAVKILIHSGGGTTPASASAAKQTPASPFHALNSLAWARDWSAFQNASEFARNHSAPCAAGSQPIQWPSWLLNQSICCIVIVPLSWSGPVSSSRRHLPAWW